VKAARTGGRDSDVIEEALRRDLGFDLLERSGNVPTWTRTRQ
jgi:hypothetical protein